jgi:hypothetical protein
MSCGRLWPEYLRYRNGLQCQPMEGLIG